MLSIPPGWSLAASQPAIVLVNGASRILVEEGLRAVDRELLVRELQASPLGVATLEYAVTCEGEYAAFAHGDVGDRRMELGFVFLDDSSVRIVGETTQGDESLGSVVRDLALTMRFFLGNP